MFRLSRFFVLARAVLLSASLTAAGRPALAHASDQGLVLLLPTDIYIAAGAAAVALTVLLLAVLPDTAVMRVFRPVGLFRMPRPRGRVATSLASFGVFAALLWAGQFGPHDPLKNPLPLFVWTLFWVGFVTLQGLFGNLWAWVNPWTGPVAVARSLLRLRPFMRLPVQLGHMLALVTFLGFALFLLADPAPTDPDRLVVAAAAYWVFTFAAVLAFGSRWMSRAEGFTVFLRSYALMAVPGRSGRRFSLGLPGWRILAMRVPPMGLAVFMIVILGTGSFDGLNETFWWLDLLGVNPLEFPGRSAVVAQNMIGLLVANVMLVAVFAVAVRTGLMLNRSDLPLSRAFCVFAPTLLPIALGYHIAHYLPSFLVESQYALAAATDPLGTGADLLGLGQFYVTTGFFNTPSTVRTIWLSQAGAVVIGHMIAVMLAHAVAVREFGSARSAALSQAPLAAFMVAYTFFGLWLLASPRGV